MAQLARQEALNGERKWRSQLVEATEKGAELQQVANAAKNETDSVAKRLGEASAQLAALNASLTTSEERANEAVSAAAQATTGQRGLSVKVSEHEARAAEREEQLAQVTARAVACEARIAEEWQGQQECQKRADEQLDCTTRYELQLGRVSEAEKAADEARALAVGKEASDAAAQQCATEKHSVSAELTALRVAYEAVGEEATALRASEQTALVAKGSAEEAARLKEVRAVGCEQASAAAAVRIAALEEGLVAVSTLNASCAAELQMHVAHVGVQGTDGVHQVVHPAWRLLRTVRQLVDADARVVVHAARGFGEAQYRFATLRTPHEPWRLDAQLRDRAAAFVAALEARPPSPPVINLPMAARPAVYTILLLALLLLRATLLIRSLRRERAALGAAAAAREAQMSAQVEAARGEWMDGFKRDCVAAVVGRA